jgi:hypothetical protein
MLKHTPKILENFMASRPKSGAVPKLSHTVTPSPAQPIKGKATKTDKAPMSTSEFSGHMRRKK